MADFFERTKIRRLESRVLPENERSVHVLEALGFFLEGTERESILVAGEYRDHFRYAFLNRNEQTLG